MPQVVPSGERGGWDSVNPLSFVIDGQLLSGALTPYPFPRTLKQQPGCVQQDGLRLHSSEEC